MKNSTELFVLMKFYGILGRFEVSNFKCLNCDNDFFEPYVHEDDEEQNQCCPKCGCSCIEKIESTTFENKFYELYIKSKGC